MGNGGVKHNKTIFIGGIGPEVTFETLWASFIPFGEILKVNPPVGPSGTFDHRGVVFIEYELPEDARAAMENMHGSEINGKPLNVKMALAQQHASSVIEEMEGEGEKKDVVNEGEGAVQHKEESD